MTARHAASLVGVAIAALLCWAALRAIGFQLGWLELKIGVDLDGQQRPGRRLYSAWQVHLLHHVEQ